MATRPIRTGAGINRRRFLQAVASLGVAGLSIGRAWPQIQFKPRFPAQPFSLGVASGYPSPREVIIWTRLAPFPDAPGGGMAAEIIPVHWEVASDERMARIIASGTSYADPAWGHSVHVVVPDLQAGRHYWYRFAAGEATSTVGRTRTAPARNAPAPAMRFAYASCQQYEQGYYGAYRHIVADDPDLVLFLGDYIYEGSWGRNLVRRHNTAEAITLNDYRARYALYKSDPDLQAAHAAAPWASIWDDHEVENDYAGERSENLDHPEWFLARRAAAYKAYYEHMPLPPWAIPIGPHMRLYNRLPYGPLASFFLVDDRQYRSPQACPRPGRGGSNSLDATLCAELDDPTRSMLGPVQEKWLESSLSSSRARWNILAQQTMMAQFDVQVGAARHAWTDGWDGYPQARKRLVDFMAQRRIANPVVIGGDLHMSFVSDIRKDFDDPASPTVASEFVGTSITSQARSQASVERLLPENSHVRFAETRYRGYTRVEITPSRMQVDLRAMESVATADAGCRTLASFVVENGRPGAQKG